MAGMTIKQPPQSAPLQAAGYSTSELVFDVTDNAATQAAIDRYEAEQGSIDIVINNAGIQHRSSLMDFESEAFEKVLAVNTQGVFHVSRAVARHMAMRGQGKIIHIASIMSKMARHHVSAYITSKAAVAGLTRAMTSEWAACGINCNAIGPGYISTELTQALFTDQEFSQWLVSNTPAGRWGEVQDLIGTAIYLAAPASDFVHGQIIFVDGGMTQYRLARPVARPVLVYLRAILLNAYFVKCWHSGTGVKTLPFSK